MNDNEILGLVYGRFARVPDVDINDPNNIIVALEKEIVRYRDRIQYAEERIKCLHERLVTIQGDLNTACDKVVTLESQGEGQRDKIEAMQTALNKKCDKIKCLENRNATQAQTIKNLEKERNEQIEELENHIKVLKTRLNSVVYGIQTALALPQSTVDKIIKALAENGYNTITINCYKDIERS